MSEAAKVPLGHLSTSRSPASSLVARRSFTAGNHLSLLFLQSIHGLPVKLKPRHSPAFWPGGGCVCLFAVPEVPFVHSRVVYHTQGTLVHCTAPLPRAYTLPSTSRVRETLVSCCVWFFLSTDYMMSHTLQKLNTFQNVHCQFCILLG